jgi:serine/threonine-protein kinase
MVTGDPPYPVDTWEELEVARRSGPGVLPETLPTPFRDVVERCLDEDPARRPGADEVRFQLTALWLADQPEGEAADALPVEVVVPTMVPVVVPAGGQRAASATQSAHRPVLRPRSSPSDLARAKAALGRPPTSYPAGRSPVAGGRAPAHTLPLETPPPKRRMALVLSVLALLVAVGGAYTVINRPRERPTANQEPPKTTVPTITPLYTLVPPVKPTSAQPSRGASSAPAVPPPSTTPPSVSTAPSPSVSASVTETLSYDDAVTGLRTAVQTGADSGEIRPDIATDLLNFVNPLADANTANIDAQLTALRGKIDDRAGEGALNATQAGIIRARVADVERAAGA